MRPSIRREAHGAAHGHAGGLSSRQAAIIAGSIVGSVTTGYGYQSASPAEDAGSR